MIVVVLGGGSFCEKESSGSKRKKSRGAFQIPSSLGASHLACRYLGGAAAH